MVNRAGAGFLFKNRPQRGESPQLLQVSGTRRQVFSGFHMIGVIPVSVPEQVSPFAANINSFNGSVLR